MGWVGGDGILCALPFSVGVVGVLLHGVDLSAGDFVRVVVPGGLYEGENGGVGGNLSGDGIDAAVLADGVRGVSELCGIGAVDFECGVVDHVAGGGLGLRPDALFTSHAVVWAVVCFGLWKWLPSGRFTVLPLAVAGIYLVTVVVLLVVTGRRVR